MKTLDEQVGGAPDETPPDSTENKPTPSPEAPVARRPVRTTAARVAATSILLALITMVVHLVIDGIQNTADDNAAIAKISPASIWNSRLSAALKTREAELKSAEATLAQAKYLETHPDYIDLDWALSDTQSTLDLCESDLLGKVTQHQYESAIADLDKSIEQLRTARSAVLADSAATPAPTTPAATG